MDHSKQDFPVFFLQYRIIPQSTTGLSPSELLMGRGLQTVFDLLHPDITKKIEQKQEKNPTTTSKVHTFSVGDKLICKKLFRFMYMDSR